MFQARPILWDLLSVGGSLEGRDKLMRTSNVNFTKIIPEWTKYSFVDKYNSSSVSLVYWDIVHRAHGTSLGEELQQFVFLAFAQLRLVLSGLWSPTFANPGDWWNQICQTNQNLYWFSKQNFTVKRVLQSDFRDRSNRKMMFLIRYSLKTSRRNQFQ